MANYKLSCAHFLIFMQKAGIHHIHEITYDLLCSFDQNDVHHSKRGKAHVNARVSAMMKYFFESGDVPYGFTIIFHYLALGKGYYWNLVSPEAHERIALSISSSASVDAQELYNYKEALKCLHIDNEYSRDVVSANNRAVDLLILFLEMNGYRYSPEISMIWFEEVRPQFKKEAGTIRRALCMVADYHRSSDVRLETVYRSKPQAFNCLPAWCREPAHRYVNMKESEGWAKSTLAMIRSSISRFCNYLNGAGIRSFREVNASHIKQFNEKDRHRTPYGKNAYNVRIRKFLIYLGEQGYLENPMLFVALANTSAPRETVIVILTEEEMTQLNSQLDDDESGLSLRKKAMLLLGLKMGLRASDIVNLKIDDINWNNASIRFIQEKTSVEVNLPMPTEVGNALFRYIMEERHCKSYPDIFLSEKAPYRPVHRAICSRALDAALPDRDVEGSGFHVTRKTYATNLLRNGVGANMVAEALGQRGTSSVHRYLSLDTERMRMCPLSLADCGIGGLNNDR